MADQDLVTETLEKDGGLQRKPGMLTPAEIIALETGRTQPAPAAQPQPPIPTVEPTPPVVPAVTPPAPPATPPTAEETELEKLEEKIRKDEPLTEEEALKVAAITGEKPEEPEPPPTYVVNGKTFTYDEMNTRMRTDTGIKNVKIGKAGEKNLVDRFAAELNKSEANKKIDEGFRENAAERQQLAIERVRLDEQRKGITRDRQLVTRQLEEVRALISSTQVDADTIGQPGEAGYHENLRAFNKKADAIEKLPELQERAAEIDETLRVNSTNIVRQEINILIAEHPEYHTSEPFEIITQKMAQGITVSQEDRIKVREIHSLLVDAGKQQVQVSEIYEYRKAANMLAVKPNAQASVPESTTKLPLPKLPEANQELADRIAAYRRKQALAPPKTGGGSGGERGTQPEKRTSTVMIEEGRALSGVQKNEFLSKELGFN